MVLNLTRLAARGKEVRKKCEAAAWYRPTPKLQESLEGGNDPQRGIRRRAPCVYSRSQEGTAPRVASILPSTAQRLFQTMGGQLHSSFANDVQGTTPCLLSDVRCPVSIMSVSGVWCSVSGVRCPVSGVRCLMSGVWCPVSGVRCPVSGAWC